MSFGLRILPAADADLDEHAAFIAADSVEQAIRFLDCVQSTYKLILDDPSRWALFGFVHPTLQHMRKRSVIGFAKHLVFYRIDADTVEIVRVLHGARDIPALFEEGQDGPIEA